MRMMESETMINIWPLTASRSKPPVIGSAEEGAGLSAARMETTPMHCTPRCGKTAPPDYAHFSLPCSYNQTAVRGHRSDL